MIDDRCLLTPHRPYKYIRSTYGINSVSPIRTIPLKTESIGNPVHVQRIPGRTDPETRCHMKNPKSDIDDCGSDG